MKILVSDTHKQGHISPFDYHWCEDNEILMFGLFQIDSNPNTVSMCGITTHKYTTHITVKDIQIDRQFYYELLSDSIERVINQNIESDGYFFVHVSKIKIDYNLNDIVDDLLNAASLFEVNQKVRCKGLILY